MFHACPCPSRQACMPHLTHSLHAARLLLLMSDCYCRSMAPEPIKHPRRPTMREPQISSTTSCKAPADQNAIVDVGKLHRRTLTFKLSGFLGLLASVWVASCPLMRRDAPCYKLVTNRCEAMGLADNGGLGTRLRCSMHNCANFFDLCAYHLESHQQQNARPTPELSPASSHMVVPSRHVASVQMPQWHHGTSPATCIAPVHSSALGQCPGKLTQAHP